MESILLDRLGTLSHPGRMAVFRLLMRRFPDAVPAGEISQALDLKPSTASVYLAALSRAELITQERQGTSLRYALNLTGARGMVQDLFVDCCGGRPDLCPPTASEPWQAPQPRRPIRVVFLCSHNAARSIMAQAVLQHLGRDRFEVFSAGTQPSDSPHPKALAILQHHGIETRGLYSKPLSTLYDTTSPPMDVVVTVCDHAANEDCPMWRGTAICTHWGLPDPSGGRADDAAFQATYDTLYKRLSAFAALPFDTLPPHALQRKLDDLAKAKETA